MGESEKGFDHQTAASAEHFGAGYQATSTEILLLP